LAKMKIDQRSRINCYYRAGKEHVYIYIYEVYKIKLCCPI